MYPLYLQEFNTMQRGMFPSLNFIQLDNNKLKDKCPYLITTFKSQYHIKQIIDTKYSLTELGSESSGPTELPPTFKYFRNIQSIKTSKSHKSN